MLPFQYLPKDRQLDDDLRADGEHWIDRAADNDRTISLIRKYCTCTTMNDLRATAKLRIC
ncbi:MULTISPECIES: hypothetical protein [Microcoleaceae]|uniref:hypothetical protein n=1 Tax=Microcoleaceae TaxID=1892252 RepID=UPI001880970F|nr:hypothetical protein [Tychonema sp. LEGE 06208]MBE9164650.1 hypothetical protein [Tychonema sp. LEGE 06208]